MNRKIIIGSRGSKLAMLYAEKAKDKIVKTTDFSDEDVVIKKITTKGDEFQDVRLSEVGGKGLFSSNIEKELQDKNIDVAVHALKDMPALETKGLKTDSFLERNDPREILITVNKKKLSELKKNSIIGTSSFRREYQIKKIRSDLECKLIRGNVDTRIKKLKDGAYDALILSYAGIKFLNFDDEISEIFSPEKIIPSAGQGIIALQCREGDEDEKGPANPRKRLSRLRPLVRETCGHVHRGPTDVAPPEVQNHTDLFDAATRVLPLIVAIVAPVVSKDPHLKQ